MLMLQNPNKYDLRDLIICDDQNISFSDMYSPLKMGLVNIWMLNLTSDQKQWRYFADQPDKLIIQEVWHEYDEKSAIFTVIKVRDACAGGCAHILLVFEGKMNTPTVQDVIRLPKEQLGLDSVVKVGLVKFYRIKLNYALSIKKRDTQYHNCPI